MNLLQPTGFRLVVDRKNYPSISYFVNAVDHPSVSVTPAEVAYKRVTSIPVPGEKLEFAEVSFDLIMDEEMAVYNEMYEWLKRMTEEKYVSPLNRTSTEVPFETDITLVILNSSNNIEKKITYKNAFPTNIGNIRMDASNNDNTVMVVPVSFRYTYFILS